MRVENISLFDGAKVLVVGGAGFVGNNLCRFLLNQDIRSLIVVDNLLSSELVNLPCDNRLEFIQGSIGDDEILSLFHDDLEYVFHLATYHGNQSSIQDPLADHANNTITTLKLCEKFKNSNHLKKLIYSSAGCTVAKKTYGVVGPSEEVDAVSLYHDSPYQISKIIGEFYGNYYFSKFRLPFIKARFQNVYGPGEILGAGEWRGTKDTVWRNVIPTFIWKSLNKESLPLENEGKASRDFIYVDDIVQGLTACVEKGIPGEVYNLASGLETTIGDLAKTINKLTNNSAPIEFVGARKWDRSGNRYGSIEKTRSDLQFEASMPLEQGLTETITWFKKNMDLIRGNIIKHKNFVPDLEKYL